MYIKTIKNESEYKIMSKNSKKSNEMVTVNNEVTVNEVTVNENEVKTNIDFTSFIKHINDVDENNVLKFSRKNNVQFALAQCGVMVNGNSEKSVPTDAYIRFKNNTQFQLQYSAKQNKFVGFNIRLCNTEHETLFKKWFDEKFDTCTDNQRILKSKYIDLKHFNDVVNVLINLPTYNRNVLVNK